MFKWSFKKLLYKDFSWLIMEISDSMNLKKIIEEEKKSTGDHLTS